MTMGKEFCTCVDMGGLFATPFAVRRKVQAIALGKQAFLRNTTRPSIRWPSVRCSRWWRLRLPATAYRNTTRIKGDQQQALERQRSLGSGVIVDPGRLHHHE